MGCISPKYIIKIYGDYIDYNGNSNKELHIHRSLSYSLSELSSDYDKLPLIEPVAIKTPIKQTNINADHKNIEGYKNINEDHKNINNEQIKHTEHPVENISNKVINIKCNKNRKILHKRSKSYRSITIPKVKVYNMSKSYNDIDTIENYCDKTDMNLHNINFILDKNIIKSYEVPKISFISSTNSKYNSTNSSSSSNEYYLTY
jgi:hypothetical protein